MAETTINAGKCHDRREIEFGPESVHKYRLRVDDLRVFYSVIGTDVIIQGLVSKEGANQWLKERGIND